MFLEKPIHPKPERIHLSIPFPRGSGSLQVQEIRSYKKEKKKRTLTNVLRDNHHPTNPRFTYWFYFQENPGVFKSKRSIPTKKNINKRFQRDNHHPTNPRFTYQFPFQEGLGVSKSKRSVPIKKKRKRER